MGNPDRPRFTGPQDPRLELGRTWRDKSTPTKPDDISPRARVFIRLVESAVTYTLALEGTEHSHTPQFREQAQAGLAVVRDEARKFGFLPKVPNGMSTGFDMVVAEKIRALKAEQEEESEFDEYEKQAFMGDPPVVQDIVNFGFREGKK